MLALEQPHRSSVINRQSVNHSLSNNMVNMNSNVPHHQIRRAFLTLDIRGDGKIALAQLGDCLRVVGANPSEKSIRKHIKRFRASHIERVSFEEFLPIYESIVSPAAAQKAGEGSIAEQLISGLRLFDEENTGLIPAGRFRRILSTCGERLTKVEMDELLLGRVNESGLVNYVEFVHAITNN